MRVCLILEGSYPYTHGGVSSWMHQYIQKMPDVEFVLWVIGAQQKDRGKYFVTPPENVREIHEIFLDEILRLPGEEAAEPTLSEEEEAAMRKLLDCGRPNWELLFRMYREKQIKPTAFLMSRVFLRLLTELCREKYPNAPFAEQFHTTRSMILPVLYLMGVEIPEADLYHAICTGYGGLLGSMAHYVKQKPLILTEHGIYSREREEELIRSHWVLPSFKQQWIQFFYMLSDATYHAASEVSSLFSRARSTQIELGADPEHSRVIGNGIHYERFSSIPLKPEDGWVDIGAVIRIAQIKDVKTLIYAFHELSLRLPKVRLHILGGVDDEEYAEECRMLTENLRLTNLRFVGQVDVVKYMEKLDFTVLSSISEGQPLSILESFAAGRPVVSTDVGCCRELINGDIGDEFGPAGYCVPPMQRSSFADGMEKLCRSRELRLEMGEHGKQRAESYFRHEYMMEKYRGLYRDTIKEWYGRNWI